ncbi:HU family DNA-binding protein [Candidatus Sumerlaeota bacterium]|nr:HU family DNA-binding protein [Candidatus Sumerlaeota bacterium]
MSLTRQEIETRLAERCGLPPESVAAALDELAQLGQREACRGFLIPGFGRLVVSTGPERVARHPLTGKEMRLPGKRKIEFEVDATTEEAILFGSDEESSDAQSSPPAPAKILPEIRLIADTGDSAAGGHPRPNHKMGGQPDWIQGAEESPVCCGREMTFFGQLDSTPECPIADGGMLCVFLCPRCWRAKCMTQLS